MMTLPLSIALCLLLNFDGSGSVKLEKLRYALTDLVRSELSITDNLHHPYSIDKVQRERGIDLGNPSKVCLVLQPVFLFFVEKHGDFKSNLPGMLTFLDFGCAVGNDQADKHPQGSSGKGKQTGNVSSIHEQTLPIVSGVSALVGYIVGTLMTLLALWWYDRSSH
jgi:hypothetical protein